MKIRVKYNPGGMGVKKPLAPAAPTATARPMATPYNPVRPPNMAQAPMQEPMDFRRNNPTPNDRPNPMPQAPTSQVPMNQAPILPQNPPTPIPGRDVPQRPGPVGTPPTPYTPPGPVGTPPVPYTPPPQRPNVPPGDPNDPSNGRGIISPTDPSQIQAMRQGETTKQRIDRLQEKLRGKGGKDAGLEARIKALQTRRQGGEKKPYDPVQQDDKPETWPDQAHKQRNKNSSEKFAELALPRGMDTMFYDNPAGDEQNKEAAKQKQQFRKDTAAEQGAVKTADEPEPEPKDNSQRWDENLAQRLKRLKAELKTADPKRKTQLQARIADLEKRIASGDTKGRKKNQPGTPQRPYRNREVSYRPLGYGGSLRV